MSDHGKGASTGSEQGEYRPAGEDQDGTFSADQVAAGFKVDVSRVHAALEGEFGKGPDAVVGSTEAQHLAEVILGDKPLAEREAALMELGAYTPRSDHDWGLGDKAPEDESDRLVRRGDQGDEERGDD
jgi:hypothetical protein